MGETVHELERGLRSAISREWPVLSSAERWTALDVLRGQRGPEGAYARMLADALVALRILEEHLEIASPDRP